MWCLGTGLWSAWWLVLVSQVHLVLSQVSLSPLSSSTGVHSEDSGTGDIGRPHTEMELNMCHGSSQKSFENHFTKTKLLHKHFM